jgi:Acetyltransferase (GNAT) family/Enoyl-(Acyl carrier protein) reductase
MYVRPAFRARGLGKLMFERLADVALSNGVSILRLEAGIHQFAAIRLYELGRSGSSRASPSSGCGSDRGRKMLAATPTGRAGDPEEMAEAVVWLCSDAASFVTVVALRWMAGGSPSRGGRRKHRSRQQPLSAAAAARADEEGPAAPYYGRHLTRKRYTIGTFG